MRVRFYSEFPELKERGVRYPIVYGVEDQLEKVTGQLGGAVPRGAIRLIKVRRAALDGARFGV